MCVCERESERDLQKAIFIKKQKTSDNWIIMIKDAEKSDPIYWNHREREREREREKRGRARTHTQTHTRERERNQRQKEERQIEVVQKIKTEKEDKHTQ